MAIFTFDLGLQHGGVVNAEDIDSLGLARGNAILVHAHHHVLASVNARLTKTTIKIVHNIVNYYN